MSQDDLAAPIIHPRPLFAGVMLAAIGSLIALVGMVISVLTTAAGARRWVRQLDRYPGAHAARTTWQQERAAGAAGAGAWRSASSTPLP